MNLQQLEYILALEEHQSFSKAAEAKFISQPALSMMIQKLEDELDLKLFDRSKKPIVPTAMGHAILQQARVILREVEKLKEVNRSLKKNVAGGIEHRHHPYPCPLLAAVVSETIFRKIPADPPQNI